MLAKGGHSGTSSQKTFMVVLSQKTLVVYVQKSEERRRGCNSRNTKKSRSNSQKLAWIKKWGLERRSYGFCYQLKLGKHFKTAQQQQMFFKNILENSINYVVCILSYVFRSIASKTSMHTIVYYSKAIRQVLIRVHWII